MKTRQRITTYLIKNRQATGKELADFLGITDRAVRKQLASLMESGELAKKGIPPKVYYFLSKTSESKRVEKLEPKIEKVINERYLMITPSGERLEGLKGFAYWCEKTNQPIEKTSMEYIKTLAKYDTYTRSNGLINGNVKLRNTFREVYLDELFYVDFYSIERFGKTKLGQLLLYAKQSQNKTMIDEIVQIIHPSIRKLIRKFEITTIGFIPPTVKREVQLMVELKKKLKIRLTEVIIEKVKSKLLVPQKTLSKLDERIENARDTMVVRGEGQLENILLLDDAVGSGATLNETAKQIRERGMVNGKIIGIAIVGSFKGFDVISEV